MNIQVHSVTGSSPYELVFGQKPHSVLFPSGKSKGPLLEEDLETDGITVEAEPLKLTEADVPLEEDGNEHDGSEQEGKGNKGPLLEKDQAGEEEPMKLSRKRQWEEEGEEEAKSKKTCLQPASLSQDATEGQEVAVDECGKGDERARALATTEKHLKVRVYVSVIELNYEYLPMYIYM